jgi:V/A-type H+-transporting ATPase subunit I
VVIEQIRGDHAEPTEDSGDGAPVELSNPELFKPFEVLVRPFSLPRYGSLDPTPYVAVFLPMFFGLILGDVGYGLLLATLGVLLGSIFPEGSLLRMVGRIALACALFTVIFGYLFGEFFGNLGHTMGWMEPILFNREEAVVPFLILTLSLGFVHLLLGLVLGLISAWRGERRRALGRGLAAVMLVLTAVSLLALWRVIPREILTPAVVLLVIAFPVLVVIEGMAAPLEMLSTLGRVLSYARIMAIGTASVMLAVVANEMAGAFGSAVVGLVFALLFHLVNFALGLFSPTIHALRLHYVEFFGTFHTPGGDRYRPLGHWRPEDAHT